MRYITNIHRPRATSQRASDDVELFACRSICWSSRASRRERCASDTRRASLDVTSPRVVGRVRLDDARMPPFVASSPPTSAAARPGPRALAARRRVAP